MKGINQYKLEQNLIACINPASFPYEVDITEEMKLRKLFEGAEKFSKETNRTFVCYLSSAPVEVIRLPDLWPDIEELILSAEGVFENEKDEDYFFEHWFEFCAEQFVILWKLHNIK